MNVSGPSSMEHLLDLLADRATEGLAPGGEREIELLLAEHPDVEPDDLDLAAAAVDCLIAADEPEPRLPVELERRLLARFAPPAAEDASTERLALAPAADGPRRSRIRAAGWWAAAAALLVAVTGWWPRLAGPEAPETPAARMESLLAEAGVVRATWEPLDEPGYENVRGDVVWNASRQEGYMRLSGLPANDPRRTQYQLWIVDPQRDAGHPVDGGVFDVPAGPGEVVVPIRAKLPVGDPKAFVLTAEQPGGVVVSDGPHLVIART